MKRGYGTATVLLAAAVAAVAGIAPAGAVTAGDRGVAPNAVERELNALVAEAGVPGALAHTGHGRRGRTFTAAASGDHGFDAALPRQTAVLVEVVASVGLQTPGFAAGASPESPNRWDGIQWWQELGDVVSVAARERSGERSSVAVDDQVVLGAGTGAVDG